LEGDGILGLDSGGYSAEQSGAKQAPQGGSYHHRFVWVLVCAVGIKLDERGMRFHRMFVRRKQESNCCTPASMVDARSITSGVLGDIPLKRGIGRLETAGLIKSAGRKLSHP
jgi:hypothetical protein